MGGNTSKQTTVISNGKNTNTKISPTSSQFTDLETIEMGITYLKNLHPILRKAFSIALATDPNAMATFDLLTKDMGYMKAENRVEAKLPPELENFNVIKDTDSVAAVLTDPTFVAAQLAVQNSPTDPGALAQLRAAAFKAKKVTTAAVKERLQEENIKKTCRTVILAGNEDFEKVYVNVWGMTTKSDAEGCSKYRKNVQELVVPDKATRQTTKDPAELFQHAALIQSQYQQVVRGIGEKVEGTQTTLPPKLKKLGRIIEKTILKCRDDPGNANKVCDIVRGMITCVNHLRQHDTSGGHCGSHWWIG